ncbi:hypothetical protein [Pedobacter gandavensis]|uniref:hypothetical protein n=1 Tax=Pedobacter gandavensis TaxID=2679963 RepID=UPI00293037CE|nr:hypothetical protein [Pedobacter gandavensis]
MKDIVGGGINIGAFSSTGTSGKLGWTGISFGVNLGVGASVNAGSIGGTLLNTVLLNDVKPTAQRSFLDRVTNMVAPIQSATITGIRNALK